MKPIRTHHTALLIGSLLLLAACNPSAPQTSEAHPASASAAGSDTASASDTEARPEYSASDSTGPTSADTTVLRSEDGKFQAEIRYNGIFEDKSKDADFLPEGVKSDKILLLQHNQSADLTISAADNGKTALKPEQFFDKLKTGIENNPSLNNPKVSIQGSRAVMSYSYGGSGDTVNESCAVSLDGQTSQVRTVCATSRTMGTGELERILPADKTAE